MISSNAARLFTALRSPFTLIVGLGLVLAACSDQTAPVDPIDESVDGITEIQDLPDFHRGWGHGNPIVRLALARAVLTDVPAVPGIQPAFSGVRTHSFVAYQRQDDGTDAKGWTRLNQRGATEGDQSGSTRGRVVCMNKLDNGLVLIADETIERTGEPAMGVPALIPLGIPLPVPEDEGTVWAVRDNGRGPHADPDQITLRVATRRAAAKGICANPPPPLVALGEQLLLPLERGFIKLID